MRPSAVVGHAAGGSAVQVRPDLQPFIFFSFLIHIWGRREHRSDQKHEESEIEK